MATRERLGQRLYAQADVSGPPFVHPLYGFPAAGHALYPALMKLARANEQKDALKSEIAAFLGARETKSVLREVDPKTNDLHIRFVAPIAPVDWAIRLGEIVHNLRSCLDNVAWRLVELDRRHPSSPDGRTCFPIFSDSEKFKSNGVRAMRGMAPESVAIVKSFQPFGAEQGDDFPLWYLHTLSNSDKHRVINLVAANARLEEIAVITEAPSLSTAYRAPLGALEHGAILFTLPFSQVGHEVKVRSRITMSMCVDEATAIGPSLREVGTLLECLFVITREVARLLYGRYCEVQAKPAAAIP
jgi:hypothetical protein